MEHKKVIQKLNNKKLKILKHLPVCTVVLYDIVLNAKLFSSYDRYLLRKSLLKPLSFVNTPKRSSSNVQLLEKKVQKQNTIKKKNYILTRSHSKRINGKNTGKNNKIQSSDESIKTNQNSSLSDEIFQPKCRGRKRRLISSNSSNELLASKNNKSSDISTYYSHECCDIETSIKEKRSRLTCRKILYDKKPDATNGTNEKSVKMNPDKNYLSKENLTFVNYNRKTEGISESTEYSTFIECNNNLHPVNVTNETNCVRKRQYKKNQNNKDISLNMINIDLNDKIYKYMNTMKDINTDAKSKSLCLSNVSTTYNNDMDEQQNQQKAKINSKNKTTTENNSVPRIIGNSILPKGTIKIINKDNLQNNASIILKLSDSLSTLNNNMNEEDKNNDNLNFLSKSKNNTCNDTDIYDTDNETTVIYENYVSSQEQLNGSHNDEIHESNILQSSCSTEINYNEDTLNKNTSNNVKYNSKKKLNRNNWLKYNGTLTKPINQQCHNDLTNDDMAVTAQLNIISKDEELNCKQYDDSCNHLNLEKLKETNIQELTLERECNNKDSAKLFKQENVEDKNDTIIITKEYKKLSVDKESYYEEENNTQVNSLNMMQNTEEIMNKSTSTIEKDTNDITDKEEDSDCISLFTDESFEESFFEETVSYKKNEPHKSLNFNKPYKLSENSFDKYVKQNKCEFNQEYAKCKNNTKIPSKFNEAKEPSNNKWKQISYNITANKIIPLHIIENLDQTPNKIKQFINGYCFIKLRKGICHRHMCNFNHDYQYLMDAICLKESRTIFEILKNISIMNFNFLCEQTYIVSLTKLSVEQILLIYAMLYDNNSKNDFTLSRKCIQRIVRELLDRKISLKTVMKWLMEYMPLKNTENIKYILECVDYYVKSGEYWDTMKILILQPSFEPYKYTVEKILKECINYENLINVQEVNNTLINKLHPTLMSSLDKHLMECFKNLIKKIMKNSLTFFNIPNFGENSAAKNIASPDSNADETLLQVETPKKYNITTATNDANVTNDTNISYVIQPIDNLPDPRSIYRDHERLWKFYVDLDRFKKGLAFKDYDYIIDILKSYKEKEDENHFFIQACCNILQTQIKHSAYHVANIIRRTVQTGTCGILGETLFNIGLNILVSLMNKEAWRLALSLIPSLNIYHFLHNAKFFLLLAEIYLANKKTIKAFDLLKYKNIICTSRAKWHVESTINDGHVRNKIMYILLDAFCNEYFEYAFFLFQFLLKDQSSQYYPIDLSHYVTKLIKLSLSQMNTTLITEMGSLILKYNFALSTITCRALISTLVHINEALAKQIYNYAERIGIYSAVKSWPVTYITISTDLTEEEMYLMFLQLLKTLLMNFGPAIEFAKPHQFKVYLILEIKSTNEQFYCAELQTYYNNKAITNTKTLVKKLLKKRFDPPILLVRGGKDRIHRLQNKSLINYLKSEHC